MASLSIRNLYKRFGPLEVLQNIDLDVEAGEFVVLVGPSGCGKSTLLAMIAGLESVSAGEISIGGRVVNDVEPMDRDIAMVFQSYALYPTMTVRQNITFGMESRHVPRAQQDAAVARVAALLRIEPLLGRKPAQLSGGQRQRVAMGRALVREPQLFLFDEPLSNLDAKLRIEMRGEMKKLHQNLGNTTVYVTHDQVEAMTLASRIAVMHQGRLQQYDQPRVVYEQPANMFVAGFMGAQAMNFFPATIVANDTGLAVALDDGISTLALPRSNSAAGRGVGRKVVLGIRPETVGDARRVDPASVRDIGLLQGVAELVEPTGPETMVTVRIAGREAIARFEPDAAPERGDHVSLAVDMGRACLFDPDTQLRI